jgi:hypothetical protein
LVASTLPLAVLSSTSWPPAPGAPPPNACSTVKKREAPKPRASAS